MKEFLWPVRVYYEDTDAGGVVYHTNYLKYMERTRTELLRSYGFEQNELIKKENIIFAVRNMKLDYLKPAKFNDQLQVTANIAHVGKASLTFEQSIYRQTDELELCRAEVRIACLSADSLLPKPIPKAIMREIEHAS